jgi:3-oxoacyl-[acyl-carrier protein] reductase
MDLGLRGRVAIVTGSSRGIGKAIATSLAAEGARLMLNARGSEALAATAKQLAESGAEVAHCTADVTTEAGCSELVETARKRFGSVDILVNNVGGGTATSVDSTDADWAGGLDLTVWPSLRLTRLVVPDMKATGRGVVIMVSSIYGREQGGRAGYQVAKSAQISLSKALAKELAPSNIRVLNVAPGSISFEGGSWWKRQQSDPEGMAAFIKQELPLGRFGRAEEVGDVVAFLCSDRASLMTGASIPVDGNQSRSLI